MGVEELDPSCGHAREVRLNSSARSPPKGRFPITSSLRSVDAFVKLSFLYSLPGSETAPPETVVAACGFRDSNEVKRKVWLLRLREIKRVQDMSLRKVLAASSGPGKQVNRSLLGFQIRGPSPRYGNLTDQ